MSLATIRTQIKTILEGVSGIGVVHEYERWASDWKKFLELFKDSNDKINGWMITRRATPESLYAQGSVTTRTHFFVLRGIYGLKDEDATELTFQALVEDICTAFRANDTLNGTCFSCSPTDNAPAGIAGIQVHLVENRVFGSVLCHYAELHLYSQESLS